MTDPTLPKTVNAMGMDWIVEPTPATSDGRPFFVRTEMSGTFEVGGNADGRIHGVGKAPTKIRLNFPDGISTPVRGAVFDQAVPTAEQVKTAIERARNGGTQAEDKVVYYARLYTELAKICPPAFVYPSGITPQEPPVPPKTPTGRGPAATVRPAPAKPDNQAPVKSPLASPLFSVPATVLGTAIYRARSLGTQRLAYYAVSVNDDGVYLFVDGRPEANRWSPPDGPPPNEPAMIEVTINGTLYRRSVVGIAPEIQWGNAVLLAFIFTIPLRDGREDDTTYPEPESSAPAPLTPEETYG